MDSILKNREISGIPALELFPEQTNGKRPLVIVVHGLEATKEHVLPYAYRIAQEGFCTVFFDAFEHGQREMARFADAGPSLRKNHLYVIIFQTSREINTIIDASVERPLANA